MVLYRFKKQRAQLSGSEGLRRSGHIGILNDRKGFRRAYGLTRPNALHVPGGKHAKTRPPGKRLGHMAPKMEPRSAAASRDVSTGAQFASERACDANQMTP